MAPDKPDTRFGMELVTLNEGLNDSEFRFASTISTEWFHPLRYQPEGAVRLHGERLTS